MKYQSINAAEQFCYHDASIERTYRDGTDLVMELDGVCVEPSNTQNTYLMAMQTSFLRMRFRSGRPIKGKFYDFQEKRPSGEIVVHKEHPFTQSELQAVLEHLFTGNCFWISDGSYVQETDKSKTAFYFDIDLQTCLKRIGTAIAHIEIECTDILMEWDAYCGLAWYEPRKKR